MSGMNTVEEAVVPDPTAGNASAGPVSPLAYRLQCCVVKRSLDASLAAVGLILMSPWFLLLAALTKLTSAGPAFYP